jgi:hypothetical protein
MMGYTIEYRGDSNDAYVVGNLAEARAAAEEAEGSLIITLTERDGWHYADDAQGDYWGSGSTQEAALRYLYGAVLHAAQQA